MNYNKLMFYTQPTKMSQTNCITLQPTTQQQVQELEENLAQQQSAFKVGEVMNSAFLQASNTNTNTNLHSTYAENFDLSLLPQDCDTTALSIPLTIYQYLNDTPTCRYATTTTVATTTATTPQIKIEETWPQCDQVKQEINSEAYSPYYDLTQLQYQQQSTQPAQLLIPPPAYPHVYPSPQSSPSQSEHCFPQSRFTSAYDSLSSSRTSLYASSPCPSIDAHSIKQELHILPPSPPESSCELPSPDIDIKSEPLDADVESIVSDLNTLITEQQAKQPVEEHKSTQVLREYLEDNSFQKKFNLKPLALESFIGDLEAVRGDIEPVISLALQHAKREADETCRQLQISHDASLWSPAQVHAWLQSTILQFDLPQIENLAEKFHEDGAAFIQLSEEEFARRVPESGNTLHAQLEIWKLACSDGYQNNYSITGRTETATSIDGNLLQEQQQAQTNVVGWQENTDVLPNLNLNMEEETDDEEEYLPTTGSGDIPMAPVAIEVKRASATPTVRTGGSHIHLWQFLKELLSTPQVNGTAIRWIDRSKGIFKIEDSVRVAKLWGRRKNRPAMNYDKLSRSIRQYYKKGIMKKTERSQRLVYQFCHPYHL